MNTDTNTLVIWHHFNWKAQGRNVDVKLPESLAGLNKPTHLASVISDKSK